MILEKIGKNVIPQKIKLKLEKYILKTGNAEVPYAIYGVVFIGTLILSVFIYIKYIFPGLSTGGFIFILIGSILIFVLIELLTAILVGFCFWFYYEFIIFRRTMEIEEVLPDFLQEVSINLRAGMSFDKALWNSIEPEFGVLEKEIEIVAKKVMAGADTEQALKEFAEKYKSILLQESLDMIIVGLRSGGSISDLIDKIVENVKDASYLRKELIASVTSYVIFITLTAIVISPALFALSYNLMQIIQSLGEKLTTSAAYGIFPIGMGYKSINPQDFILFSKISVIIIASVSSMIIADLREGSIIGGIKYILIFIPISYFVYVGMLGLFLGVFGVMV